METRINNIDSNWQNIKNKCRTTVGKEYTENEPTQKFKYNLLISEHSPIRLLTVDWSWQNIKSWVATHWCRHKWECFISTQRTDRTGVNRDELSQSEEVKFDGNANAQHLIDSMRKRLCFQASKETRACAASLKTAIKDSEPELAEVLVPNCIYRMGCPEFECCGYINGFINRYYLDNLHNIKIRYDLFNKEFFGGII